MIKVTGRGTIIPKEAKPKNKCRRWKIQVPIGRDPVTGKYRSRSRNAEGTYTEAEAARRTFINELESGLNVDSLDMTMGQYAMTWYEEVAASGELAKGTLDKYDVHVRTIVKNLGGLKLKEVRPGVIEQYKSILRNGGSLSGAPLSGATAHGHFVTLSMILESAVIRELIPTNPCRRVKFPKCDTEERKALSEEDARRLVALLVADIDGRKAGALLAMVCGLRRGEVCGLEWGDLMASASGRSFIRVVRNYTRGEMKEPKTKESNRPITIPAPLLESLLDWKEKQRVLLEALEIEQTSSTAIVSTKSGEHMHPENFYRWWTRFAKRTGFEGFVLHELRHTFATIGCDKDVNERDMARLMGHSGLEMLDRVYAHRVAESEARAMDVLGEVFFSTSGKEACEGTIIPMQRLKKGA